MKALIAALMIALVAVFLIGSGAAHATSGHPPHWTDGTTCQGGFCPGGPPPLPAEWEGVPCHSDLLIDPPTYVFVTVHASTNGVEFDSEVVPYTRVVPGKVHADGTFVDGHTGVITLTWNMGLGVSQSLAFDCTTPESTTTTTERSTCQIPEGCDTTTTTAAPSTTTTTVPSPPVQVATPPVPVNAQPITTG